MTIGDTKIVVGKYIPAGAAIAAALCPRCHGAGYDLRAVRGGTAPHRCPSCAGAGVLAVRA